MNSSVLEISTLGLALSFVPSVIVLAILYRWRANAGTALYATTRMLVQLLLIGYVLIYIFETDHWGIIMLVLAVMLGVASWIAIRPLKQITAADYLRSLLAITIGGVLTLALVTAVVLGVEPWFAPRYVVPLAGMIFAGSMTAVSLAADRLLLERERGTLPAAARRAALNTAMIPIVNSLFAVGLVALPGMMTGQVLSGVSPLIAAKYQIVVMTMLFGATGLSAAIYITLDPTVNQS
jgi:putative ABC transport system permease protein